MSGSVARHLEAATAGVAAKSRREDTVFAVREEAGHTLMLDVRRRSGARLALPYAYLVFVDYNPSEGVKAVFTSHGVLIKGRNLRPVYEGLLLHRVEWVQEGDARHDTLPETDTWISGLVVTAVDGG